MLLLLAAAACERAEPTPPPPREPKPDPVQQARAEFEVLPDGAAGTHKLYSRGDFAADLSIEEQFDEGDFIGRLRTLFGPRDGDQYVLRHRKTGFVITAYCGKSGPAFGAQTTDDAAAARRKAADPTLAAPPQPADFREMQLYVKHVSDAEAGPELAATIAHLDALVEAVPPADWEKTEYYDEAPGVYRVGAKQGHAFNIELPAAEAFEFLAKSESDEALLEFYVAHPDELASQRPRALAAFHRFVAAAKRSTGEMREALLAEARELAKELGTTM